MTLFNINIFGLAFFLLFLGGGQVLAKVYPCEGTDCFLGKTFDGEGELATGGVSVSASNNKRYKITYEPPGKPGVLFNKGYYTIKTWKASQTIDDAASARVQGGQTNTTEMLEEAITPGWSVTGAGPLILSLRREVVARAQEIKNSPVASSSIDCSNPAACKFKLVYKDIEKFSGTSQPEEINVGRLDISEETIRTGTINNRILSQHRENIKKAYIESGLDYDDRVVEIPLFDHWRKGSKKSKNERKSQWNSASCDWDQNISYGRNFGSAGKTVTKQGLSQVSFKGEKNRETAVFEAKAKSCKTKQCFGKMTCKSKSGKSPTYKFSAFISCSSSKGECGNINKKKCIDGILAAAGKKYSRNDVTIEAAFRDLNKISIGRN